jgi:hypothetical protein
VAAAPAGQDPVLRVAGQQMATFAHNSLQRAVLALPGRDVPFVRGAITPAQVSTHRPSYINAILIQSRGVLVPGGGCLHCRTRGSRPFLECRRLPGHFGGSCGSCKWRDHAERCTAKDNNNIDLIGDGDSDDSDHSWPDNDENPPDQGNNGGMRALPPAGGSAANPIQL